MPVTITNNDPKGFCELTPDRKRIAVYFHYSPSINAALKEMGGTFKSDEETPHWTVPLTLDAARELRQIFASGLELGAAVRSWARIEVRTEKTLHSLVVANDADLKVLPKRYPLIAKLIKGDPIPGYPKTHIFGQQRRDRSYQRADIAMMAQANAINANQPGCLAADTVVELHRNGKSYKLTVDKLYRRFNGLDRANYNYDGETLIRCATSDGYIRLFPLKAAYDSGAKQTYEVVTETGRKIRATHDHPILTDRGWCGASKISVGQFVYVDGGRPTANERAKREKFDSYHSVPLHPLASPMRSDGRCVVLTSRLLVEAHQNRLSFVEYLHRLRRGPIADLEFLDSAAIVHHNDGNHQNNAIANLRVIPSQSDHAREHGAVNWRNCTSQTTTERVVSVAKFATEATYDLELASDPHNFLANGFVVHNTGKTIECLGAIIEGGYIDGPNLISAPIRSLENVWRKEIETWLPGIPVFTSEDSSKRKREVAAGLALAREGKPCFVLVNSDMLRVKKWKGKIDPTTGKQIEAEPTKKTNLACKTHEAPKEGQSNNLYVWGNDLMRDICAVDWQTFTVDEFHQEGLNNPLTLFTIGSGLVKADRHWRMSGTPMGGKPINLFPVLRSVEPARFSNKGKWVDRWLESYSNGYGNVISGIKDGLEEDFYNAHARHMVRRLKHEALPGIPRKQIVEVTCKMTQRQKAQYIAFENDAEIEIQSVIKGDDPAQVVGTCILAQFTRLKQFANAYCVANEKGEIVPTEESGKLAQLEEKLDELGIRKLMPEPNARAIISSESKRMAKMVHAWLEAKGIDAGLLTGDTKPADSQQAIQWFQEGDDGHVHPDRRCEPQPGARR
jgi:hypothetical protein